MKTWFSCPSFSNPLVSKFLCNSSSLRLFCASATSLSILSKISLVLTVTS